MTKIVRPDGSEAVTSTERLAEIREDFHDVCTDDIPVATMNVTVADLLAMIEERDAAIAETAAEKDRAWAANAAESRAFDDLVRRILTELPERRSGVPPKLRLSLAIHAIEKTRDGLAAAEARLAQLDSDPWFSAMNSVLEAVEAWKKWNATESRWSTSELHLSDCHDRLVAVEAPEPTVERCRRRR